MRQIGHWKKAIAVIAAISILHLAMSMIVLSIGVGRAAGQIEERDERRRANLPPTITPMGERIFIGVISLLVFPLITLISLLGVAGVDLWPRTTVFEFAPFILNSILWSAIVYNLYMIITHTINKQQRRES